MEIESVVQLEKRHNVRTGKSEAVSTLQPTD